jgi:Xaa-Pro aminopeptidase
MLEDLRKANLRKPLPKKEMERRWRAVRQVMEKEKLDCLIMQSSNQYFGGYVRYLTELPVWACYPVTVIFPLNDDMTTIIHGSKNWPTSPPEWAAYGVKERVNVPTFPSAHYTLAFEAKAAVDTLRRLKIKSLGVVGPACMSAFLFEYVKDNLSNVTLKDASDLVDEIKAVKSEEEIRLIKKTAEMQDIVFRSALAMIRPGVREYELYSEIQRLEANWGSDAQLNMIGAGPVGKPVMQKTFFFSNRTLQYGDSVVIMMETNGEGGLYTEIGRTVCIGEAPDPMLKIYADMTELQDQTVGLLRPGAKPAEIIDVYNKGLAKMGYPIEDRTYAHGQGYDILERPLIRPDEPMTIKEGMNIAVHPMAFSKEAYAFCCDNYIVTKSGAVRIHKTPREVFVL